MLIYTTKTALGRSIDRSDDTDEEGYAISAAQRNLQIEGWLPFEEKYFRTKFLPLTLEITKDMKQAKEYLGLNTKVEDLIQELGK